MTLRRSTRDVPYLLEPSVKVFFGDSASLSLSICRLPVPTRLPLHQYEFNIILYDRIRLVGLSKKLGPILDLIGGISDFVPKDRVQVVESDAPANDADIGMQRKNQMTSEIAPRNADIPDDAHQTATWNKDSVGMPPDLLQLKKECFVVLDMTELVRVFIIPLEFPVGGGG